MHVSVPSTHKNELNVSFFVMPAHLYQQNPSPCRVPPTQVPSCPPEQPSSQPAPQTCLQEEGLNLRKQHELLCVKKKEEKTLLELRASDSMYSAPAKLKKKKKKKKPGFNDSESACFAKHIEVPSSHSRERERNWLGPRQPSLPPKYFELSKSLNNFS